MPIKLIICLLSFSVISFYSHCLAEASESKPFLPTWKLLNAEEKARFISGYLHGWSDAKNVTGIAIDFIKDNPGKAVNSLEDIKRLYDVSFLRPEELVEAVDAFYGETANKAAPLSVAVTAAKIRTAK